MFKIVNNERLSDNMFRVTFEAPLVARKAQPGQFLMFRVDEFGERMPITICLLYTSPSPRDRG